MLAAMRATSLLLATATLIGAALVSCANKEPERKAVPPTTTTSKIPWNSEGPSGGGAQFSAMPQSRHRR